MSTIRFTSTVTAVLLAGFLAGATGSYGQPAEPGLAETALGGASAGRIPGLWMRPNPGRIAALSGWRTEAYVGEGFGLRELRLLALTAAVPWGDSALGVELRTFGFDLYREIESGLGYARTWTGPLPGGAGLLVTVRSVRIPGFESGRDQILLGGGWVRPDRSLYLGGRFGRIYGASEGGRTLTWGAGLGVRIGPDATFVLDVDRRPRNRRTVRSGIVWRAAGEVDLLAGWTLAPRSITLGLAVRARRIRAGLAGRSHPVLGWTRALSVGAEARP